MGDSIQRRPLVMDRFNPVRAGAMSIKGLSLIDTFGQVKVVVDIQDASAAEVITTTDQTPPPGVLHQALLSPRLAQPARLRFEWLPAEPTGGRRTNDHPGTNPVCGFLLVNNLDGALAVYDKEGRALGSVDRANAWRTAPESGDRVRINARGAPQLPNAHLQQVVDHVLAADATFLRSFLSVQRTALETIDPEAYAECPSRALLMARAVAVVRASLTLELQGPPAFDPSAVADPENDTTTTRNLEKVKFPLRLGEFAQLDDSLVGYFVETPDGAYKDGLFYSPQLRGGGHAKIRTHDDGEDAMSILRTTSDPDLHVTLLLDPRAQVHATIGVVPSPQMRLAPEHYSKALESMEVSFLTAPLLTDLGALRLVVGDAGAGRRLDLDDRPRTAQPARLLLGAAGAARGLAHPAARGGRRMKTITTAETSGATGAIMTDETKKKPFGFEASYELFNARGERLRDVLVIENPGSGQTLQLDIVNALATETITLNTLESPPKVG
jgi:hypothetical protein